MLTPEECDELCEKSVPKIEAMRQIVRGLGSGVVAFSGGVDSALVLKIAVDELGNKAVALTAFSPSVAEEELQGAKHLAQTLGATHVVLPSHELSNPSYAANPSNRCYFCKTELYSLCELKRVEWGLAAILDGFNADDRRDHRPGHVAAQERQVLSPLAQVNLSKNEIRAWSRKLALPTWDKPQMPCLASRIPYGTAVTKERLEQIGSAESRLRNLGLREFRVRYHGTLARLEVAKAEFSKFSDPVFCEQVHRSLREQGFLYVALDLEPFRSGRLNDALAERTLPLPLLNS